MFMKEKKYRYAVRVILAPALSVESENSKVLEPKSFINLIIKVLGNTIF